MALSANSLADKMEAQMNAVADSYRNGEKSNRDAIVALATAIIAEITDNAEVRVTGGSSAGVYKVE